MSQIKLMMTALTLAVLVGGTASPGLCETVPDRYKDPAKRVAADSNIPATFSGVKVPPLRALCRQNANLTVDRMYYDDGSLYLEVQCRAAKRHGKLRIYRPDGELWSEADYLEDVREGSEITFYPGGAVQQEETYVKGQRDGQRRQYYPDGTPKRDSFFRRGKKLRADVAYSPGSGDDAAGTKTEISFEAE